MPTDLTLTPKTTRITSRMAFSLAFFLCLIRLHSFTGQVFSQSITNATHIPFTEKRHENSSTESSPELSTGLVENTENTFVLGDYWQNRVAHDIELYGGGAVLFIGSFGNILSLVVLCRKRMRRTTTAMYLACLSFVDLTLIVLGQAGRHWTRNLSGIDPPAIYYWYCKIWYFIINVTASESSQLLAGVSAERCLAVLAPLKSRLIITKKSTIAFIVGSFLFNCTYMSHSFWSFKQVYKEGHPACVADLSVYFVRVVRPWTDLAVVHGCASVIIVICNMVIITALIRASIKREAYLSETNVEMQSHTKSIVIMLIAISVAFVALTTPIRVAYIIGLAFPAEEPTGEMAARTRLMWAVNVFLLYCNHSINFWLCVISGSEFRKELFTMFAEICGCKKVGTTVGRISLALGNGNRSRESVCTTPSVKTEDIAEWELTNYKGPSNVIIK